MYIHRTTKTGVGASLNNSFYVINYHLAFLFFFPLSQNVVTFWMIDFTLLKWLKASFPVSIVAKCHGILNDSLYVTKWLEASLPFPLVGNAMIRFRNNSFGSCAWSSKLNKFEKKCALSSEPNDFMRIIESKKVRLEFELRIVEFRTPGDTHFWLD